MSRRGNSIRKRSDGRWEGRYIEGYTDEGKAKYKSVYGHTYGEVKNKLMERFRISNSYNTESPHTFAEIALLWVKERQLQIKKSTYDKYISIITNHLQPVFGYRNISEISVGEIENYLNDMYPSLSISSMQTILSVIKSIFCYANKLNISSSTIRDLRLPKAQRNKKTLFLVMTEKD